MNHNRSSGMKIKINKTNKTDVKALLYIFSSYIICIIDYRTNTSLRLQQKYMNNLYILFFI